MSFAKVLMLAGIVCLGLPAVAVAQCFEGVLLTVSEDDNIIREVDPDTLQVIAEHQVETSAPFGAVLGLSGIAFNLGDPGDPSDDQVFILLRLVVPAGNPIFLGTYDLNNDDTQIIGNTAIEFVGLTYDDDGRVLAIASDAASPVNAFCELSQATGSPLDLCAATAGDSGDAVAYVPASDSVYHAAGTDDVIFELINDEAGPGMPCGTTAVDISSTALVDAPLGALTWLDSEGGFLWTVQDASNSVYDVTTAGAATLRGNLDHVASGMTIQLVDAPCPTELFVRGDIDGNGSFTAIIDGLFFLNFGFVPGAPAPPCMKAADVDGSGGITVLVDALFLLNWGFVAGAPMPPAPHPNCGVDPASTLPCDAPLDPSCI